MIEAEVFVLLFLLILVVIKGQKKHEPFISKVISNEMKGLAVVLILLWHYQLSLSTDSPIFLYQGGYQVGIFLLLSGYGLFISTKFGAPDLILFFNNRLKKILVPFLIVWIAALLLIFSMPKFAEIFQISLSQTNFLEVLYLSLCNSPLWFVPFIFFWYIGYALISSLPVSQSKKIILLFAIGILIVHTRPLQDDPAWALVWVWFKYALCFPIGVIAAYKSDAIGAFFQDKRNILFCLVGIFLAFLLILGLPLSILPLQIYLPISYLLATVGFLFAFYYFFSDFRSSFLKLIGAVSYEFYLVHFFVLSIFLLVYQAIAIPFFIGVPVVFIFSFLAALAIKRTNEWAYSLSKKKPLRKNGRSYLRRTEE